MKGRGRGVEFCCLAIPLINFGAYTICLEFIFVALCVALLAIGPPSIVATNGAIPSGWPKAIVCIFGFINIAWQFIGIFSIKREKTGLYRIYIRINFILTLLTILITLAFFAVSAARHSVALTNCVNLYGNTPEGSSSSDLSGVGTTICNIFLWVQVGCMGLLIALIGLTQVYMCYCQRAYGQEMRRADQDQKRSAGQYTEGIPLANRGSGIWDANALPSSVPIQEQRGRGGYGQGYTSRPGSDGSIGSREDLHPAYPSGEHYKESTDPYHGAAPLNEPHSYESGYQQSYESHHDQPQYGRYGYREQY